MNSARMLRLSNYGLTVGCAADLMVLDAPSVPEAVLTQATRLAVFKGGQQVAGALPIFH